MILVVHPSFHSYAPGFCRCLPPNTRLAFFTRVPQSWLARVGFNRPAPTDTTIFVACVEAPDFGLFKEWVVFPCAVAVLLIICATQVRPESERHAWGVYAWLQSIGNAAGGRVRTSLLHALATRWSDQSSCRERCAAAPVAQLRLCTHQCHAAPCIVAQSRLHQQTRPVQIPRAKQLWVRYTEGAVHKKSQHDPGYLVQLPNGKYIERSKSDVNWCAHTCCLALLHFLLMLRSTTTEIHAQA